MLCVFDNGTLCHTVGAIWRKISKRMRNVASKWLLAGGDSSEVVFPADPFVDLLLVNKWKRVITPWAHGGGKRSDRLSLRRILLILRHERCVYFL